MQSPDLNKMKGKSLILTVGLWGVGFFIGMNFIVSPGIGQIKKIRQEKELETKKAVVLEDIAALQTKNKRYRPMLSESQEVSWLIEALNQMAQASSIALTSVTPLAAEPVAGFKRIPVRIQTAGNYHQIGDFVSRVESESHFIKIDSVEMENTSENVKKGRPMRLSMVLSVFYPK